MSAALAAVTTANVAPAIITIFITVLFLKVRRNKAVTCRAFPSDAPSMNVGIRLQCGRQDTFEGKVCSAADMRHPGTCYIWTITAMRSGRDQVCGFVGHQLVAEHAGFFARRLGRKAAQQDQQRLGGLSVGGAMRQHALDHPAPQSGSTPGGVDKSGFMADFERHAECREGRFRQSGPYQQRLQAGAARSALSQLRATANCASVSDSLATSATRVAAGRSSSTSIDSRIAARWPCRSTI